MVGAKDRPSLEEWIAQLTSKIFKKKTATTMPPKSKSNPRQKKVGLNSQTVSDTKTDSGSHEEEESSDDSDQSDSSSQSSSSSDTETNTTDLQNKNCDPTFTLSCLRNWDSHKMEEGFKAYLSNLHSNENTRKLNVSLSKITKNGDFTPWWDDFLKLPNADSSKTSTVTNEDPDSFHNWFDKSQPSGSSSRWLCGPSSSKTQEGDATQPKAVIEDIEVPSIYDQTPQTKGRRQLKKERKAERQKTLGKKWYDMRAPEVDDATRMDMELIRMRGVLDPKRFYKHNDRKALPKYFQMGTVVDEGTDFYSSRLTKKQRKQTLVEELMADANVRQYNKRKYAEVQQKMRNKKKVKGKKEAS